MRVVVLSFDEKVLKKRRKLGHDRWDEVWEGELHMVPPPHSRHGRLNERLGLFFITHWEDRGLGRTYVETGVKRPGMPVVRIAGDKVPSDYRTPDRSFLLPARYSRLKGGWIVGGPNALIEIVSPGDESRKKLSFYFSIGVKEVIFIERDSLEVELQRARASGFERVKPDPEGWIQSDVLSTELRRETGSSKKPVLHLRRSDEPSREVVVEE